jgi:NDP-sugar pyrophosphorylase family protein
MDDGAEVHRRARIVAPAYVGRASKVMEDTLITRFSSIEKGCCIDYGTVIENSSILENTQVGICLDVCHAVANGNKLLSLGHDVVVEISDPSVLRFNSLDRKQARDRKRVLSSLFSRRKEGRQILPELQTASASAPERCGFEPNPIQG